MFEDLFRELSDSEESSEESSEDQDGEIPLFNRRIFLASPQDDRRVEAGDGRQPIYSVHGLLYFASDCAQRLRFNQRVVIDQDLRVKDFADVVTDEDYDAAVTDLERVIEQARIALVGRSKLAPKIEPEGSPR